MASTVPGFGIKTNFLYRSAFDWPAAKAMRYNPQLRHSKNDNARRTFITFPNNAININLQASYIAADNAKAAGICLRLCNKKRGEEMKKRKT